MTYEKIVYKRAKLYRQVWSKPMSKLSKDYGLSDFGLRKICGKLKVPLPKLGYWSKKKHGKAGSPPPLPPEEGLEEYEAEVWNKSQQIRAYIGEVRKVHKKIDPNSEIGKWLEWANKQADRMDPLAESPPSILDEKDKYPFWD